MDFFRNIVILTAVCLLFGNTAFAAPILKLNSHGHDVMVLQQNLMRLNYSVSKISGNYDKETQECIELEITPNNFFTRKYNEGDKTASYTVEGYAISRQDEMGNGVQIYVDKRLGKIVGASAFGD